MCLHLPHGSNISSWWRECNGLPHPHSCQRARDVSRGYPLPLLRSWSFTSSKCKRGYPCRCTSPLRSRGSRPAGRITTVAMLGHAVGRLIVRGGAQRLTDALASYLRACGGRTFTSRNVRALSDLPADGRSAGRPGRAVSSSPAQVRTRMHCARGPGCRQGCIAPCPRC